MALAEDATVAQKASYEQLYQAAGITDEPGFYRWILGLLRLRSGGRLLDVACGEGGVLAAAQRVGVEPCGLDISANAILKARARYPTATAVIGNAELLPFAPASFDGVTCLGSLENFSDPQRALNEIRRVLKARGVFCAMMPNKFWLGDILRVGAGHEEQVPFQRVERLGTMLQWRKFLESNGFSVERVYGYTKTSPLIKRGKLRSLRKFALTHLTAAVSPTSLAWSIVYLCRVSPDHKDGKLAKAWLWRAEWFGTIQASPR